MAKTKVKKTSNGYNYKYTDLAAIHEELEAQGITYYQYAEYDKDAGSDYIYTVLKQGEKEEEPRRGCRVIDTIGAKMNAAQAQGSGITYARRYSLLMALGWATEDDDGASVGQSLSASSGRLDFDRIKEEIAKIDTVADLLRHHNKVKKEHNLTEKQTAALKNIYGARRQEIQNADRDWDSIGKAQREADEYAAEERMTANYELNREMEHERLMDHGE